MNNKFENYDFYVSEDVRLAFETAQIIAGEFTDSTVRTSYLLIALLKAGGNAFNRYFFEHGLVFDSAQIVKSIILSPELFEELYGKEVADNFYYTEEDERDDLNSKEKLNAEEKEEKSKEVTLQEYIDIAVKNTLLEEKLKTQVEEYEPDIDLYYSENLMHVIDEVKQKLHNAGIDIFDADNLIYAMLKNKECSAYRLALSLMETIDVPLDEFITFMETDCYILNTVKKGIALPSQIESCCEVFNERFEKGQKSDILGRDKEKRQLWNIFSKKTKRNAILVGDAGVGKTAIIEAITQDIINETCPKRFHGYTVLSFSVEASVAGTKYRGEFEQKISTLKKFLEETKDVILFIDEIHATVGAGSTEGNANDLSGSLKSILARGDVIVVGTTTREEYDRFIAKDTAYKRRFERVNVREPKYSEVKKMIKVKIENLENFHGVKISDNIIDYIITTSACFASTSSNPDKTLDLCDRAMSLAESENVLRVTKKHVRNVFEDSYEKYKKFGDEANKLTAYHEAAHYVVGKVTGLEEKENVIAISILPSNESLGVNVIEKDESIVTYDKKDFLNKIAMLLAGRAVEVTHFNKLGTGAESDILHATMIAKSMLTRNSLAFLESDGDISPSLFTDEGIPTLELDEDMKKRINKEVSKILKEQFEVSKEIVTIFSKQIEDVASALLSNYVLTREELDKIYSENLCVTSKHTIEKFRN